VITFYPSENQVERFMQSISAFSYSTSMKGVTGSFVDLFSPYPRRKAEYRDLHVFALGASLDNRFGL
jgi:hypothetical protein